jgi:predicted HTH transcriptional regulator
MKLKQLKELVHQGEGLHLEFKLKASHPEKIIRGIVAFANTTGGKLLIGVNDDKQIPGLKFADEDEYVLVNEIEKHISPPVTYTIERVKVENEREVLVFSIPESPEKPHYVDFHSGEQPKAYVRVCDKSIQASKEVKEILKGQRKAKSLRFSYGDKENQLMKYLDTNESISVDEFARLADIPRKSASRTLVLLSLTSVLKCIPDDHQDRFSLN